MPANMPHNLAIEPKPPGLKVAIQGEQASFHDIAATHFFGEDIDRVCCKTFAETFQAVDHGKAKYAVSAIENSLYGSINEVYDLLLAQHFPIIGETYIRVKQCLIAMPGTAIGEIREVYSHPVALAQCEQYLDTVLAQAQRFETNDTAGSVGMIKLLQDPKKAAIASAQAATLHGLDVLASSIETNHQNYTRFVVLSRMPNSMLDANKTSLILKTAHTPGALYAALGAFAKRSINLTKLQSRPIIGHAWHYMFYLDVEAGLDNPSLKLALQELARQKCQATILGSYKAGTTYKA